MGEVDKYESCAHYEIRGYRKPMAESVLRTEEDLNVEIKTRHKRIAELEEKKKLSSELERQKRKEAALESESKAESKQKWAEPDVLTADVFCKELQIYQENNAISERQQTLCVFTKRCIIEENEKCPLTDVELMLDFSFEGSKSIKMITGNGGQIIRSFFDEKDEPQFRWEKTGHKRRLLVFFRNFLKTENVKDMVKKLLSNPKSMLQNAMNTVNGAILWFTVNKIKADKKQTIDESGNDISTRNKSKNGSEQIESGENIADQSKAKKQALSKGIKSKL